MSEPPALCGHEDTEATLIRMAHSGRLPHAMMLAGPRGIGKATLAVSFARWLLAGHGGEVSLFVDPDDPVARRIAAKAHADLLIIERAWDTRRKRLREEIVADDARAIAEFFHLTPAEGGWRIAIIDGVEVMNRHAANAVLKILEEPPPNCLLILVTHEPRRLLPTIRSRCRNFSLAPLASATVEALLTALRPSLAAADHAIYSRLAGGSIGRAIELADGEGVDLYRAILGLLGSLPHLDLVGLHSLADRAAKRDSTGYDILTELLPEIVARLTTAVGPARLAALAAEEGALIDRLPGRVRPDRWVALWSELHHLFQRATAVNLDRKQVVLDAFLAVAATAAS